MAILSDKDIAVLLMDKTLKISPLEVGQIQPASVDLRLGSMLKVPTEGQMIDLDPSAEKVKLKVQEISLDDGPFLLKPGQCVRGATLEELEIPDFCNAKIFNKNSLALHGLTVTGTCYINPGYKGHMSLFIKNEGPYEIKLHKGVQICQLEVCTLQNKAHSPYSERYSEARIREMAEFMKREFVETRPRGALSRYLEESIKNISK